MNIYQAHSACMTGTFTLLIDLYSLYADGSVITKEFRTNLVDASQHNSGSPVVQSTGTPVVLQTKTSSSEAVSIDIDDNNKKNLSDQLKSNDLPLVPLTQGQASCTGVTILEHTEYDDIHILHNSSISKFIPLN